MAICLANHKPTKKEFSDLKQICQILQTSYDEIYDMKKLVIYIQEQVLGEHQILKQFK